ncbi:MAG: rod shape-determining protein MreC [Gammaproteobacteria bacterium]
MAFGVANSSLPGRGPTPGLRFVGYAFLSIALMFLDRREGWMEQVRYGLQAATYPLQIAVSSPSTAWSWVRESARTRETLRAENGALRSRLRDLELRTMRYEALSRENAVLRGLSTALPPVAEKWLVAEIVHVELDDTRVLINRGSNNGVFKSQAVLSDEGVVGQTTHVGPWSAELILITDPEHDVPVEIERTGARTIAVGRGIDADLALPYLPGNADVKPGDLLITSGMGGVFPQGYPVARVVEVRRDAVEPLAQVRATPLARINRDREVMLVWFRETHPAAPVRNPTGDLQKGDANAQPQNAAPECADETQAGGCDWCGSSGYRRASRSRRRASCGGRRVIRYCATHRQRDAAGRNDHTTDRRATRDRTHSSPGTSLARCRHDSTGSAREPAFAEAVPSTGASRMTREPRGWMVFTSIVALFLTVLPLPGWLNDLRPAFVVLTVLYFSITWPRAGGIGLGFFCGLALERAQGADHR